MRLGVILISISRKFENEASLRELALGFPVFLYVYLKSAPLVFLLCWYLNMVYKSKKGHIMVKIVLK
jgi:hypothetical protein